MCVYHINNDYLYFSLAMNCSKCLATAAPAATPAPAPAALAAAPFLVSLVADDGVLPHVNDADDADASMLLGVVAPHDPKPVNDVDGAVAVAATLLRAPLNPHDDDDDGAVADDDALEVANVLLVDDAAPQPENVGVLAVIVGVPHALVAATGVVPHALPVLLDDDVDEGTPHDVVAVVCVVPQAVDDVVAVGKVKLAHDISIHRLIEAIQRRDHESTQTKPYCFCHNT